MAVKRGEAYLRGDTVYLVGNSMTTQGLSVVSHPVRVVPLDDPAALGQALKEVLAATPDVVPHPADWKELGTDLFACAGVKTWSAFYRGAKLVHLEWESARIAMTSMRQLSTRRGFVGLAEDEGPLTSSLDDAELGRTLAAAFDRCR